MRSFKILALAAVAAVCLTATTPKTQAQIGISIGVAPECPYGYHDYAPYNCAPYGYYGPEWFNGGVFVGAGPWFHGPENFRGHVNNHYDVQRGYKGTQPNRGDQVEVGRENRTPNEFKGNEARDGRGHVTGKR